MEGPRVSDVPEGITVFGRNRASAQSTKTNAAGTEPSVYTVLQRVSVVIGLLALAPLTGLWQKSWWIRVPFVLIAVTLLAATTHDLLPPWVRRRPVAAAILLALALGAIVAPEGATAREDPVVARATIASPGPAQHLSLTVREAGGYTDGFIATGTCQLPHDHRALIVSLADDGTGYWLLSDGILNDCEDDGATHRWTAGRVDPSWPGMAPAKPVTLGIVITTSAEAGQAQTRKALGEPLTLPPPSASVLIYVSRVQ